MTRQMFNARQPLEVLSMEEIDEVMADMERSNALEAEAVEELHNAIQLMLSALDALTEI